MFRAVVCAIVITTALTGQQADRPCDLANGTSHRALGREALAAGRHSEAIHRFQLALDACPAQSSILLEMAQAYTLQRDLPQAIRLAQKFLEREPGSVEGRIVLGNAQLMAQQLPEALDQARQALARDRKNAAALKLKGNCEYLGGKPAEAIDTFLMLLDAYPNDDEAAYMLGRIYYQEGRIGHAIGQFQRVLRINPKSYKAYDNLGLCHQAHGDSQLAIQHFLTAIKLAEKEKPEYDWAYANLASLLIDQDDAEHAFAAASKAADRNPNSPRNFFIGAKALNKMGKRELALNWLQRSIALDPDYAEALYFLARVYREVGQEDKAKETFERFREVKQRIPQVRK
jgi:tetratricopeptide (TPR) repeat protein